MLREFRDAVMHELKTSERLQRATAEHPRATAAVVSGVLNVVGAPLNFIVAQKVLKAANSADPTGWAFAWAGTWLLLGVPMLYRMILDPPGTGDEAPRDPAP